MTDEALEAHKVVVTGIHNNNVDQVRWAIQREPSLLKRSNEERFDNNGDGRVKYFFEDVGGFTMSHLGFSDDVGYEELDELGESEGSEVDLFQSQQLGYVHGVEKANQILLLSPAISHSIHKDEMWRKSDARKLPSSPITQLPHRDLSTEYDPLSLCIICGRVNIARVLICELGADCSKQFNSGGVPRYPSCLLVKYRQPDILRLMIEQLSTEDLNAIAMLALLWCNTEILDVLYENGMLYVSSCAYYTSPRVRGNFFPETYRVFSPSQVSTLLEWLIERDLVNESLLAWLQRSCLSPVLSRELNRLVDHYGFVCCDKEVEIYSEELDDRHFLLTFLTATSMPSFDAYRWWNDFDGWDDYKLATCVKDLLRPDIVLYRNNRERQRDYPIPLHRAKDLALAARLIDKSPQILLIDVKRGVEHNENFIDSYYPLVEHISSVSAFELLDHSLKHLERFIADDTSATIVSCSSNDSDDQQHAAKRRRKGDIQPERVISEAEKLAASALATCESILGFMSFQIVSRCGSLSTMLALLPSLHETCGPYRIDLFWKLIGEGLAAALQCGHRDLVLAFLSAISTEKTIWGDANGAILAADSCRTALMRRHDWELVDFVNKLLFFTGDAKDALAETVRDELLHQVFRYQWYEGQCQAYYLSPAVECIYRMHFGECLEVMHSVLLRASHSEASLDYRLEMCRRFMLLLDYTVEKFGRRTLDHVEIPQLVVFMVRYGPMEWLRRLHAHDMLYPTDECRDDRYMGAVCRRGSVEVLEMIAEEAYRRGGVGELRKMLCARDAATRMLTTVQVAERYGDQGVVEWLGRLQERVDVEML